MSRCKYREAGLGRTYSMHGGDQKKHKVLQNVTGMKLG